MANLARDFGKEMVSEPSPKCIGIQQNSVQGKGNMTRKSHR